MADPLAKRLMDQWGSARPAHGEMHWRWREVRHYALESHQRAWGDHLGDPAPVEALRAPGPRHLHEVVDSTAAEALVILTNGIDSILFGDAEYTLGLDNVADDKLPSDFKAWAEDAAPTLNAAIKSSSGGWDEERQTMLQSLCGLGTGAIYLDERVGHHLLFRSVPLCDLWVAENGWGQIDAFYRRAKLTPRAAVNLFGAAAPETAIRAMAEGRPYAGCHEFLHAMIPTPDDDVYAEAGERAPFTSYYVDTQKQEIVRVERSTEQRFVVGRWIVQPGSPYGWSQTLAAMPWIRRANEMERTNLKAGQLSVEKPLYMPAGVTSSDNLSRRPNALNLYDPSPLQGAQFEIRELPGPTGLPWAMDQTQQIQDAIKRLHFTDKFAVERSPQMTAAEWYGRQNEMWRAIGKPAETIRKEVALPIARIALRILVATGVIQPPPRPIDTVKIGFPSPEERVRKAAEADGIARTIQTIAALAPLDPDATVILDTDATIRAEADANGTPPGVLKDEVKTKRDRAAKQQERQRAQIAELAAKAAPGVASLTSSLRE